MHDNSEISVTDLMNVRDAAGNRGHAGIRINMKALAGIFPVIAAGFFLMNSAAAESGEEAIDFNVTELSAPADAAVTEAGAVRNISDAGEHKRDDTSYNVLVKKIPNLKRNTRSREYQKKEIIRLINLSRDVCDTYADKDPESIICRNPKLMYLESEYLKYLGLKYDEHGCVFGCALHRGRLSSCVEHRFSASCVENYFDVLISEERIDQGYEEAQEMVLDCVPAVDADVYNGLEEEEKHQLVILNMYATPMPVGHFSIKGRNYNVYGFPQYKGEYLRDMNSLCYDCDYKNQLRFVGSRNIEIEIRQDDKSDRLNCEIH